MFTGANVSKGAVRLLTGDIFGELHTGGGEVKDVAADGDLVLFTAVVNPSSPTPGLPRNGLYLRKISEQTLDFVGDTTVSSPGVLGAAVSEDGKIVVWSSTANGGQIYRRNIAENTTVVITRNISGNYSRPRLSADGRFVAYTSNARTLAQNATHLPNNGRLAVYLYDSNTNQTSIVSLSHLGGRLTGVGVGGTSLEDFDLSKDGNFVVYATEDPNAHPARVGTMATSATAVYRRDLNSGELLLLNRNSANAVANGIYNSPRISADGGRVAFIGSATGLPQTFKMVSNFPFNRDYDVYVKDVDDGTVWGLTKTRDGAAHLGSVTNTPVISDSGDVVAFPSDSQNLISNDDPANVFPTSDIFRADLFQGGVFALSLTTSSFPSGSNITHITNNPLLTGPVIAGNGRYIAYSTTNFSALGIEGTSSQAHSVGTGDFPAPPSVGVPFFIWAFNLPFDKQGANDNPSGDGVPNLLKFFIGSNAQISDRSHLPVRGIAKGTELGLPFDSSDYMTLTVRIRRELRNNYNWTVESSNTPTGFLTNPVPAIRVGNAVIDGAFDIYLYRYPVSMASSSGRGFMRLKVSIPSEPEF